MRKKESKYFYKIFFLKDISLCAAFCVFLLYSSIVFAKPKKGKLKMLGRIDALGEHLSPQWAQGEKKLSYLISGRKPSFGFYDFGGVEKNTRIKVAPALGEGPATYYSFAWSSKSKFAVLGGYSFGSLALFLGEGESLTKKLVEFEDGGEGVRFSKLCWLPDDKGIVYSKNGIFFKADIEGNKKPARFIKASLPYSVAAESWGEFNPVFPHIFAFELNVSGRDAIYIYDVKKNTVEKVVDEENYSACHPTWSPDGKKIAFFFNKPKTKIWVGKAEEASTDEKPWRLWVTDFPVSKPKILSENFKVARKSITADFTPIAWTPESRNVLFAAFSESGVAMYVSESKTGKVTRMPMQNTVAVKEDDVTTSWKVKITSNDIACSGSYNGAASLAFAGEVNLGELISRILIIPR